MPENERAYWRSLREKPPSKEDLKRMAEEKKEDLKRMAEEKKGKAAEILQRMAEEKLQRIDVEKALRQEVADLKKQLAQMKMTSVLPRA